ncbi:MAG: TolC family protein, partial [Proteobacteria bacterium]|nr:TolC family protein [Pseudomonadota bacterium]
PDIRAAEARLKALNAQVGIRKASRFPSITLTGSYGYSSSALGGGWAKLPPVKGKETEGPASYTIW